MRGWSSLQEVEDSHPLTALLGTESGLVIFCERQNEDEMMWGDSRVKDLRSLAASLPLLL